jgi:hypothetical protein
LKHKRDSSDGTIPLFVGDPAGVLKEMVGSLLLPVDPAGNLSTLKPDPNNYANDYRNGVAPTGKFN